MTIEKTVYGPLQRKSNRITLGITLASALAFSGCYHGTVEENAAEKEQQTAQTYNELEKGVATSSSNQTAPNNQEHHNSGSNFFLWWWLFGRSSSTPSSPSYSPNPGYTPSHSGAPTHPNYSPGPGKSSPSSSSHSSGTIRGGFGGSHVGSSSS